MKKIVIIVGIFLMACCYFLLPRTLESDGFFQINKKIDLQKEIIISGKKSDSDSFYSFLLGQRFVYFDENLQLLNLVEPRGYVGIGDRYYVEYNDIQHHFTLYDTKGIEKVQINDEGLPIIGDNSIFSLHHKQGMVKNFSFSGELLWTYNIGSYITAFDIKKDFITLGGMNGYVTILDIHGKQIFEFRPSGSEFEIIYGATISENAEHLAIISGMSPQRFILFKKGEQSYIPFYQHEFKEQFPKPMRIKFSKKQNVVVYEEPGFLNGYHIGYQKSLRIPIEGVLKDFDVDIFGKYLFFVSEDGSKTRFRILSSPNLFPLVKLDVYSNSVVTIKGFSRFLIFGVDDDVYSLSYQE